MVSLDFFLDIILATLPLREMSTRNVFWAYKPEAANTI